MELEALPFTINGAIALGTLLAFQGIVARRLPSLGTSALLAVLLVGTGCCVDYISRREFPVHNSGAVVMTGASSGIGRGAAIALAKEGFAVFAGVRNERDAASIRGVGMDRLIPIILDVTKTDHIEAAVKTVEASGLLLVAVVNNAGITDNLPVEVTPLSKWRKVFDVNLFGAVEVSQHFLPLLRRSAGRIVNVGSIMGDVGSLPSWTPYSASKHALEAVSDTLRNELHPFGVSVSLVQPGAIRTDIWQKMNREAQPPDYERQATEKLATEARGSDAVKELYKNVVAVTLEQAWEAGHRADLPGTEVTDVAIIHAVVSPRPKARYLVGQDAKLLSALHSVLPDRVFDAFVQWFIYKDGWRLQYFSWQ